MSLFKSIVVTVVITLAVWTAVIYQPQNTASAVSVQSNKSQPTIIPEDYVELVHQTVRLDKTDQLWDALNMQLAKHSEKDLNAIVLVYNEFSADFSMVEISAGIVRAEKSNHLEFASKSDSETSSVLLPPGYYDEVAMEDAWLKVNYNREIEAIVEVHYMESSHMPGGNSLTVFYKNERS
ncbi:hypothetical protein [Vibrio sp. HN007]|uniref:hypothetical protein n=1 Tax=Vibrio iocasae TaxID=3098914 RepID=UPI0035D522FC